MEYLGLCLAILIGACVLVRFSTPVDDLAASLVRTLAPHRSAPVHRQPRIRPRRPAHRVPHPCLCPVHSPPRIEPERA